MTAAATYELRVLVLAPFGRDARLTQEVLADAGLDCLVCADMAELCTELKRGAGTAVVAAEGLHRGRLQDLVATLAEQPSWSDIPLVLATTSSHTRVSRENLLQALSAAGHVTVLERPIHLPTLLSVLRSALNARRRQYQMRGLIEELRASVERLDAEHAVRERFVELLAHDLHGPMGAAKMTAQLLARRPELGADDHQAIGAQIERSVDRAEQMIRNLLDAHSLRAGYQLPVDPQECELTAIGREVIEELSEAERARVELAGREQLTGVWDPELLRRALWNLVSNAIKYGRSDTPVTLSFGRDDDTAWAAVHNWGPSIEPAQQRRLNEPFVRVAASGGGAPRGWGLGLTLVHGVAQAHDGSLEVASEPDAGTRFTLRLPLNGG